VRAFWGIAQATLLMAVILLGVRAGLVSAGLSPAVRLLILVLLGTAIYVAACLWRAPEISRELRTFLRRRPTGTAHTEALRPGLSTD
jgi:hypothetical protein